MNVVFHLKVCAATGLNRLFAKSPHRKTARLVILAMAAISVVVPADGQSPLLNSVNDLTQTPISGSGHDYQHMLGETINFSNGSVSFKISFPTPASRGFTLPYRWSYNSSSVNTLDAQDGLTPQWNLSTHVNWPTKDGWNISEGVPSASIQYFSETPPTGPPNTVMTPCNYVSGIVFLDSSGVSHNLPTAAVAPASNASNAFYQCRSTPLVIPPTGDGQAIGILQPNTGQELANTAPTGLGSFVVEDKSGTVFSFNLPVGQGTPNNAGAPWEIEDRNGNYISAATGWKDTAGRALPSTSGNPPTSVSAGGEAFTASWGGVSVSYTVASVYAGASGISCQPFNNGVGGSKSVLSSLTLPNGKQYQFFYSNNYGLLSEIIFPDGGWIKYNYQLPSGYNEVLQLAGFTFDGATNRYDIPQSFGCAWEYNTPVLSQRTVSFDGTNVAQTQTFQYSTTWQSGSWTGKSTTVTTTDNVRNISSKTVYTYLPASGGPLPPFASSGNATMVPQEDTITYYDWGQTSKIKMVKKTWYDNFNEASETTTIYTNGGSLTSKTAYSYTSSLCNSVLVGSFTYLLEQDEYAFAAGSSPGPIIKKTLYNYKCFQASNPSTYQNYSPQSAPSNWGSTYQGIAVPPQIYSVVVEDGGGNILSASQYNFDEYGLSSVTPNQYDPNYNNIPLTSRANLTSALRCNPAPTSQPSQPTSSSPICSTGPKITYTYDVSGQPISITDPKLNTTQFSFADQFTDTSSAPVTNAYLTNIKYPVVNGITPQKNFKYIYALGYLTTSIDENGNSTSYTYADPLARLTQITHPDGGETQYTYNDSANTVTTSTLQNSSGSWITSVTTRDGMFHTTQIQQTSDPLGAGTVKNTYDGEGKLWQKTNPYRGSTNGTSYYYYDALGRTVETKEQDGNTVQNCYDGIASFMSVYCSSGQLGNSGYVGGRVDTTDEQGNHWQRVSDSLGRLIQVTEPNGSAQTASMETDYMYDSLDDLTQVDQYGGANGNSTYADHQRKFTYDSLGRLLTALNPETGTVTYNYLNGGSYCAGDISLPCLKTDNRGIGIKYTYDALNRITSKTYTSDPNGTPLTCYQYDSATAGIGLLSNLWTMPKSSSCAATMPSSGFLTTRSILSYDQMGRIASVQQRQCVGSTCSASSPYALTLQYDKAGEPTQLTNSVGAQGSPLTLTTYFDGAQRPCLQTSSWGTSSGFSPNLFQTNPSSSTPGYTAFGGLQNWFLGSNSSTASTDCTTSPSSAINPQQVFDQRMRVTNFSSTGQVP